MSDLISRQALERKCKGSYLTPDDFRFEIRNAPAIEQGEPVAELKITWGSDTGYEYGLTLIGGALASQKEYDDWIVSNFKGEGIFKLYTTPQQPQSVADALEESAKNILERKQPPLYPNEFDGGLMCYNEGLDVAVQIIRALIKRNAVMEGE